MLYILLNLQEKVTYGSSKILLNILEVAVVIYIVSVFFYDKDVSNNQRVSK